MRWISKRCEVMMLGVAWLMGATVLLAQDEKKADAAEVTKEIIRQWVAVEQLLGSERLEWTREQARLGELLELHTKELTLLKHELAAAGKSAAGVDEEKIKLQKQVRQVVAKRRKMRLYLLKLRPRVLGLVKRFPQVLRQQVGPYVDTLVKADAKASVRELLLATVNIFDEAAAFQRGVLLREEVISIAGEAWSAEVLYLGLGRAYFYVGGKAGVGTPGAEGWSWERRDEIANEVKKAIKIFKKSSQPQLVELPVKLEK